MDTTPQTVWTPASGEGEFVPGTSAEINDASGNLLVDASSNNLVDSGNTFNAVPLTVWSENNGS